MFSAVQRLEASNTSLLEGVNKILQVHITLQNDLQALTKRVEELESKSQLTASPGPSASSEPNISKMHEKIDDLENRSRRSNVLFYGISDTEKSEAWDVSERLVHEFCTNKLGITVSTIARAHRIGCFSSDKPRPIIAKLYNEKEVESVMGNGFKLKYTTFSVSRDYSEAVRDRRRKLWQFSKIVKKDGDRVRLNFNKLLINNDTYYWDTEAECAVRTSQPVASPRNSDSH